MRTTNAIERLNEEFRYRIKPRTVLPCAGTVPMVLWPLLASEQMPLLLLILPARPILNEGFQFHSMFV